MRAPHKTRWITAVELGATVPATCKQLVPGQNRCRKQVGYLCDQCAKPVCGTHLRSADAPRTIDIHNGHVSRALDAPALEICVTCSLVERHYLTSIEELTDAQVAAFLATEDAIGYVGAAETPRARNS